MNDSKHGEDCNCRVCVESMAGMQAIRTLLLASMIGVLTYAAAESVELAVVLVEDALSCAAHTTLVYKRRSPMLEATMQALVNRAVRTLHEAGQCNPADVGLAVDIPPVMLPYVREAVNTIGIAATAMGRIIEGRAIMAERAAKAKPPPEEDLN